MFEKKIRAIYDSLFAKRCDNPGYLKYFTYLDFPDINIKEEKISFISQDNNTLRGGLYYNLASIDSYDQLIIFCHGIGAGYLAYMTEISALVSHGFLVMAYDVTGTFSSDGKATKGFCTPLVDLGYAYRFIKEDDRLKNKKLSIIGHSWGGFTALNSLHYISDFEHVVAISAPLSVKSVMKSFLGPLSLIAAKQIMAFEEASFGNFAKLDGLEVLKTHSNVLLVYSKDDLIVKDRFNYKPTRRIKNQSFQAIIYKNRDHHPTYSDEARAKFSQFRKTLRKALKAKMTVQEINELFKDLDWHSLVMQDMALWEKIVAFLKTRRN